ncbi:hypothetical protein AB0F88_41205 [Streptosporangium sp. NPDC023963]|uniref:hypothetical protein n=1 Tax=Streptosporangium sp. NPDC023963 TaxID=3155608 RepID=UPI00343415C2
MGDTVEPGSGIADVAEGHGQGSGHGVSLSRPGSEGESGGRVTAVLLLVTSR